MTKPSFEEIWARIVTLAGAEFTTIKGLPFTYHLDGEAIITSRTDYRLSRDNFLKAMELLPIKGPGEINKLVRGPTYIWAILHDPRVRRSNW